MKKPWFMLASAQTQTPPLSSSTKEAKGLLKVKEKGYGLIFSKFEDKNKKRKNEKYKNQL